MADQYQRTELVYRLAAPTGADFRRLVAAATVLSGDGHIASVRGNRQEHEYREPGVWAELHVQTASDDRIGRPLTSALVRGASRAAAAELGDDAFPPLVPSVQTSDHEHGVWWPVQRDPAAPTTSGEVRIGELVDEFRREPFFDAFTGYATGLHLSSEVEQLVRALFEHTAEPDPDLIAARLGGGALAHIAHEVNPDLDWHETSGWYGRSAADILRDNPHLHYSRLADPGFRDTDFGRSLGREYARFCGRELAQRYAHDRGTGGPAVPLTRYPVLEGLIEDSILGISPEWRRGEDVVPLALASDSERVKRAVITAVTTRVQPADRHPSDAPAEFQVKRGLVAELVRAQRNPNTPHRELLTHGLIDILTDVTVGATAHSLQSESAASRRLGDGYDASDLPRLTPIATDLIRAFIVSADPELRATAIAAMRSFCRSAAIAGTEPSARPRQTDLRMLVIDALDEVTAGTDSAVFAEAGALAFGDGATGRRLEEIAQQLRHGQRERSRPEVVQARAAWAATTYTTDAAAAAKARYERVTARADRLAASATRSRNEMLFALLGEDATFADATLARELVERVRLPRRTRSREYRALLAVGADPRAGDALRAAVAWQIGKQFQHMYRRGENRALVQAVVDTTALLLGPVDDMRPITADLAHGLGATRWMATSDSHGTLFSQALPQHLALLEAYRGAVGARVAALQAGDGPHRNSRGFTDSEEYRAGEALRDLDGVARAYDRYLYIQDVQHDPRVYYGWMLDQMGPFWSHLQMEVGPGYRPSTDLQRLHGRIGADIQTVLDTSGAPYPDDFDPIDDGGVDLLLRHCHDHMVLNHDLGYNGSVWNYGLPFLRYAVSMMPQPLADRVRDRHASTRFATYIDKVRGVEQPAATTPATRDASGVASRAGRTKRGAAGVS